MKKRVGTVAAIVACLFIVVSGSLCVNATAKRYEARQSNIKNAPRIETLCIDVFDESENKMIESAVIDSIGTDREKEVVGYDFDKLCRIITTEGGEDYAVCYGVAQACYNTHKKLGGKLDPVEICEKYQYAHPAIYTSNAAREACINVFIKFDFCEDVGESTIFYNPMFGWSDYHEGQVFVTEINGVRFFEETT